MAIRRMLAAIFCAVLTTGVMWAAAPDALAAPSCSVTEPNARVVHGSWVFGGVASATSVKFFVKKNGGTQTVVPGTATPFGPTGWIITFDSTTKTDGYYTATCQATDGSGTGAMSTPVPFAIHNVTTTPLAGPSASTRGADMGFSQTTPTSDETDAMGTQGTGWVRGGAQWNWVINNDVDNNPAVHRDDETTWAWDAAGSSGQSYIDQVDHAHALGLKFMAVAMGSPYYANDANDDHATHYPNQAHLADWQLYIRGLITQGAGGHGADAIEVWNEPNNVGFVDAVDPAFQAALQRYTYDYVKANWPNVLVIAGGNTPFPHGNDFCSPSSPLNPGVFLADEYSAPAASYNGGRTFAGSFDALGYHPYALSGITPGSGFGAPSGSPNDCGDGVAHTRDLMNIMTFVGDIKPIWLTEWGIDSAPGKTTPADVGPYMTGYLNGFILLRALTVPIGVSFEYNIHDSGGDAHGTYNSDWTEKASAALYRADAATAADTTAPAVSGVSVTSTGLTTANVSWTTSESATSSVRYGPTTAYGQTAVSVVGTSHTVTLTGLVPGQKYNYVIDSYDGSANKSANTNRVFTMDKPYDTIVKKAGSTATITSGTFSTSGPALVVAFAQSGGPASPAQTLTVGSTTPGLTFSRTARANSSPGSSEIWTATTTGALTNATVSSTEGTAGYNQYLTVMVFERASGIGASQVTSGTSNTPLTLVATTQTGSIVISGGSNITSASVPAMPADEVLSSSSTVAGPHVGFWSQYLTTPTPSSHPVVVPSGTLPGSAQWNFAAIEIRTA